MRLREDRAGQDLAPAEQAAAPLALVGVARSAPELVRELPREPVGAAGAERDGATRRVQAADRLVANPALLPDAADHVGPSGCFADPGHPGLILGDYGAANRPGARPPPKISGGSWMKHGANVSSWSAAAPDDAAGSSGPTSSSSSGWSSVPVGSAV